MERQAQSQKKIRDVVDNYSMKQEVEEIRYMSQREYRAFKKYSQDDSGTEADAQWQKYVDNKAILKKQ